MKDWFYTVLYRRQIDVRQEHVEQVRLNAKRRGDTSVRTMAVLARVKSRNIGGDEFALALRERRWTAHGHLGEFAQWLTARRVGFV
jgi:hypothetical protein